MKRIIDSRREILQIIFLILCFPVVYIFDVSNVILSILGNTEIDFTNIKYYYLGTAGNFVIAALLAIFVLFKFIRAKNKEKTFNKGPQYHNHSYSWYWFCSKILGYSKCSLIRVPIYMQFKLVINEVFDDYVSEELDLDCEDTDAIIEYSEFSTDTEAREFNIILEDTYSINSEQLPDNKINLPCIKISRYKNEFEGVRKFNSKFVDAVAIEINKLPVGSVLNIFSTINPKHCLAIAKQVFSKGNRGNIEMIHVFQQESKGNRVFNKSYKVL